MSSDSLKILIVDDSQALRVLVKEAIQESMNGLMIYEADDGKKALEMFSKVKPDLVIMDLFMPQLGGLDAIKVIHKHNPNVKILVLTVSQATRDTKDAIAFGASDVVYKPFRKHDLANKIMQQLKEKIIVEQKERKNTQQISVVTSRLDYRLKILICEDEEQIGKMYKMALEAAGHRAVLTHNGERCLSEFEHALTDLPFDVVVLDYKLPDMTGDIIANKILSENPDQRIFFVSAYGNTALTNLGPTGDKINFLTKPVSLVTLVEKIEETEEEDKKHHLSSQIQK